MKINREARNVARRLFSLCRKDEAALRTVVEMLAERKPRNYLAILARLRRLAEIDWRERTATVETATALPDGGKGILTALRARFPDLADSKVAVKPELLGGMRLQVGSQVWDSSISGRLAELTEQF